MKLLQKQHFVSVPQMLLAENYLPKRNPDGSCMQAQLFKPTLCLYRAVLLIQHALHYSLSSLRFLNFVIF